MIDIYDDLYKEFRTFLEDASIFSPKVVKRSSRSRASFPVVYFVQDNDIDTDEATIDFKQHINQLFFTVEIYTKNAIVDRKEYTDVQVAEELKRLTDLFFSGYKKMKRTRLQPVPNLDDDVYRYILSYQCKVQNWNNKIIRR